MLSDKIDAIFLHCRQGYMGIEYGQYLYMARERTRNAFESFRCRTGPSAWSVLNRSGQKRAEAGRSLLPFRPLHAICNGFNIQVDRVAAKIVA